MSFKINKKVNFFQSQKEQIDIIISKFFSLYIENLCFNSLSANFTK